MSDHKFIFTSLLCLFVCQTEVALAQFPGGGDPQEFAARMLRRLDRDENGSLDPDELERSGPLKDYLARHDVDVDRPVPLGVVADHQAGMFQEMREQGGFGGGPGGFGGPPGGGAPSEDKGRGSFGGQDQSDRNRGGRSDGQSNSKEDRRGSRRGDRGTPGASNQPAGKDAKSKVRVGRVGPKVTLPPATLPSQYSARDINQDGQIGMYEWSRSDLSTFRKLDINDDGFLTPAELAAPPSSTAGGSTTVASTTVPARSYGSSPASAPAKPASAPSEPPADLKTVAAQGAFEGLDTDKNSQLSEEEWNRSRYARKLFTDAKVEITFPLAKAKFVESYVKLAP